MSASLVCEHYIYVCWYICVLQPVNDMCICSSVSNWVPSFYLAVCFCLSTWQSDSSSVPVCRLLFLNIPVCFCFRSCQAVSLCTCQSVSVSVPAYLYLFGYLAVYFCFSTHLSVSEWLPGSLFLFQYLSVCYVSMFLFRVIPGLFLFDYLAAWGCLSAVLICACVCHPPPPKQIISRLFNKYTFFLLKMWISM